MEKSSSIQNLAKALIIFHVKVDKIPKDATNPFFKSKYASLSNILETINIPLNESGLTFSQFPCGEHGLNTILMHAESGEYISEYYIMKPSKDDPQGIGSAITYQRRYALASVLGLNIDDDDDANAASKTLAQKETLNGAKNGTSVNKDLPWLNENTKDYNNAVNKLILGTVDIATIKKNYKLSKQIEEKLLKSIPKKQLA